jgi:hypothetical protein
MQNSFRRDVGVDHDVNMRRPHMNCQNGPPSVLTYIDNGL